MPSPAPGSVTARINKMVNRTYGNVAVKYTTYEKKKGINKRGKEKRK